MPSSEILDALGKVGVGGGILGGMYFLSKILERVLDSKEKNGTTKGIPANGHRDVDEMRRMLSENRDALRTLQGDHKSMTGDHKELRSDHERIIRTEEAQTTVLLGIERILAKQEARQESLHELERARAEAGDRFIRLMDRFGDTVSEISRSQGKMIERLETIQQNQALLLNAVQASQ